MLMARARKEAQAIAAKFVLEKTGEAWEDYGKYETRVKVMMMMMTTTKTTMHLKSTSWMHQALHTASLLTEASMRMSTSRRSPRSLSGPQVTAISQNHHHHQSMVIAWKTKKTSAKTSEIYATGYRTQTPTKKPPMGLELRSECGLPDLWSRDISHRYNEAIQTLLRCFIKTHRNIGMVNSQYCFLARANVASGELHWCRKPLQITEADSNFSTSRGGKSTNQIRLRGFTKSTELSRAKGPKALPTSTSLVAIVRMWRAPIYDASHSSTAKLDHRDEEHGACISFSSVLLRIYLVNTRTASAASRITMLGLLSLTALAASLAVASPIDQSQPLPSILEERQTLATSPGAIACTNLTKSLGASKVQTPISLKYQESKFEYWNAVQSNYNPTCAVYPTSAQDVSTALKAIKAAKSRFAIKAAGHNPNTFFSSVDAGVLIDLNSMTARTYDASTTIGTYQPGGTFGDIYNYFQQFGRTVVGARLAGVGTGLALGGGLSYLSPQYGLACDSFRELEVVLPSGQIVTASPTQNSDLFFADRGGGGNAYGVVTKYTIQTRKSGTFYAGNIIYLFNQSAVLEAIRNFVQYNTDPKASIIGTYEKLTTPAVGDLDLDQAIIMFLVYDGPNSGDAFKNFTSIPSLFNSLGQKTYPEVVNMPIPMSTELSRGNNIFRVQVHRTNDDSYKRAFDAWEKWCETHKGQYVLSSLDFQPIPKSLTDASKSQNGGNAMQMPDGPWFWLNYLISTPPTLTSSQYDAVQASFRDMVNSVPNAAGLPLFINDANYDQNPLKTFTTYSRLQAIKKRFDPDGFFAKYTGGWNFNA